MSRSKMTASIWADPRWPPHMARSMMASYKMAASIWPDPRWPPPYDQIQNGCLWWHHHTCDDVTWNVWCHHIFSIFLTSPLGLKMDAAWLPCPFCGKEFRMKNELDQHVRVQHGNHQHQCDGCGSIFTRKDNLNRHRGTCGNPLQGVPEGLRKAHQGKSPSKVGIYGFYYCNNYDAYYMDCTLMYIYIYIYIYPKKQHVCGCDEWIKFR